MTVERMPLAEVVVDESLVRALLRAQHLDLAALPLAAAGEGWDNTLFRLGGDLLVRLPRRQAAAALIDHERRWLPLLAPRLPLAVPAPVRAGVPGCGYPWSWVVAPWFDGETAVNLPRENAVAAQQLGEFVAALHHPAPAEAPANPFRTTLAARSDRFLEAVRRLGSRVDAARVINEWRDALAVPAWTGPPLWLHGDLHPANVVARGGRLTAVIDFGDLTAGDPAIDLAVAWMAWSAKARRVFRAAIERAGTPVDDATWRRARGWALSLSIAYLAHSRDNAVMSRIGERTLRSVFADADP